MKKALIVKIQPKKMFVSFNCQKKIWLVGKYFFFLIFFFFFLVGMFFYFFLNFRKKCVSRKRTKWGRRMLKKAPIVKILLLH